MEPIINDNNNNNNANLPLRRKKYLKLLFIILFPLLIITLIIIILFFTVFKKNNSKEDNQEDKDNPYELDTISKEELDNARDSFKQYNFSDSFDNSIILSYNIFIPESYDKNKKYPLVVFIADENTIGKNITTPLTQTVGGPIWATQTVQKKNECFVLVPQYKENITKKDGQNIKKKYLNITVELILNVQKEFNIDSNRIYGIGQSVGALVTLYLLNNTPNLYTAALLVDSFYINKALIQSLNTTFTYISCGNHKEIDKEIKEYLDSTNINYGKIINLDSQENMEILNQKVNEMYSNKYKYNFISYEKNKKILPFKHGYRIEAIRNWIFAQNKIICNEGYYDPYKGICISNKNETVPIKPEIKKRIFLITNHAKGDLLLNLLKNISFISEVRIGSPNTISEMTESFLLLFDCVIYDFQDSGYGRESKSKEIEAYIVNNGGSFLVTHDHWDSYPSRGPLHLLGMEFDENGIYEETNKAKVSQYGHSIFDSYYNIINWRIINIASTHRTFHKIINQRNNTAKIVMEFEYDTLSENKYDYLVANEIGYGRVAYWAAGHSPNISDDEKKLFINIVAWLTKFKN